MRLLVPLLPCCVLAACGPGTDGAGEPSGNSGGLVGAMDGSATELDAAGAVQMPEVQVPEGAPVVVFLGDSISAGLHLPAERAFPAVLQRRAATEGLPFELINAGVSGDTSAGGLSRVDWLLRQEPDLVVLELGGNDGLRGQPLESIEKNLAGIIERVRGAGAEVLLLGMRLPTSYGAEYGEGFAALYPRLAEEEEVPFVPFFMEGVGGNPELNLPDELHPSIAGHELLAENVLPELLGLLEAVKAREGAGSEAAGSSR